MGLVAGQTRHDHGIDYLELGPGTVLYTGLRDAAYPLSRANAGSHIISIAMQCNSRHRTIYVVAIPAGGSEVRRHETRGFTYLDILFGRPQWSNQNLL